MEISGAQSSASMMQGGPKQPPPADVMAERMVSAVDNGDIDQETLISNLEEKFGEDAAGVVGDDGAIDVEALTELLASAEPSSTEGQQGGMQPPPPPPPGGGQGGMMSTEDLTAQLSEDFGEEAAASVMNDDGSVDFEALKTLLDSQGANETGVLLNTTA